MYKTFATALAITLLLAACGDSLFVADPVGEPAFPDLIPAPSVDFNTAHEDDGTVLLRFSSVLVNVGDGDFHLRAHREAGEWQVEQLISYSETGGELMTVDAPLLWGGDGHDHWHIGRVAHYWIVALDERGEPMNENQSRADTKVGFCFFDHLQELDYGPEEAVFSVHDCGGEDDTAIRMGMSPGWSDKYLWNLPGQQIEITDLEDGMYRLWAEADPNQAFFESTRDNNRTWVDFELTTLDDGRRGALALTTGPTPEDHRS